MSTSKSDIEVLTQGKLDDVGNGDLEETFFHTDTN